MRRVLVALLAGVVLTGAGCTDEVPVALRPAQELVDSLGLRETDVVYEVGVSTRDGAEVGAPSEVRMELPGRLSFRSDDPRARRIVLDTAALSADLRAWFAGRAIASPPLVQRDARWVVDLRDAPTGTFEFVALGGTADGRIRVVIPPRD